MRHFGLRLCLPVVLLGSAPALAQHVRTHVNGNRLSDGKPEYVVSGKTIDTTAFTYASDPQKIYFRLIKYVDDAEKYKFGEFWRKVRSYRGKKIREIQVAVPEITSPSQWHQIYRAISYAKSRDISMKITMIK
jgi:hypothetical protein